MEHWTMRAWAQRGGWRVEWVFKFCSSGSEAAFIDCSTRWTFSLISPNLWVLAEKDRQTKHHITMQDWTGTTKEKHRELSYSSDRGGHYPETTIDIRTENFTAHSIWERTRFRYPSSMGEVTQWGKLIIRFKKIYIGERISPSLLDPLELSTEAWTKSYGLNEKFL